MKIGEPAWVYMPWMSGWHRGTIVRRPPEAIVMGALDDGGATVCMVFDGHPGHYQVSTTRLRSDNQHAAATLTA
jgi:hypothetical protein